MRLLRLAFILWLLLTSSAFAQLRVEVVDRSKLQLTFDPALPAQEIRVESDYTLPVTVHSDGRRKVVVPLVLRPQAPASFEVRAGGRQASLDLAGVNLLPVARTRLGDECYQPVEGVPIGASTLQLALIAAAVVLVCLIVGALLRKRMAGVAVIVLGVLIGVGAALYLVQRPVFVEQRAVVELAGQGNVKPDAWVWLIAQRDGTIDWLNPVPGRVPRVLAMSRPHLSSLGPEFICDAEGNVTHVRLTLARGTRVALVLPDANFPANEAIDRLDLAGPARDYYRGQRVLKREPGRWRINAVPD